STMPVRSGSARSRPAAPRAPQCSSPHEQEMYRVTAQGFPDRRRTCGWRRRRVRTSVEVVAQDLRAAGVAQLRHRLGLDLTDPLAGHAVDLADLVEGLGLAV